MVTQSRVRVGGVACVAILSGTFAGHPADPGLVLIQARKQGCPRGTTATRVVALYEPKTVGGKPVQMGRFNLRAVTADVTVPHVVRHDDHDVWPAPGTLRHAPPAAFAAERIIHPDTATAANTPADLEFKLVFISSAVRSNDSPLLHEGNHSVTNLSHLFFRKITHLFHPLGILLAQISKVAGLISEIEQQGIPAIGESRHLRIHVHRVLLVLYRGTLAIDE